MNLSPIWSALEENMNMLGNNYGYPALFKLAEELAPESYWLHWIPAVSLFGPEPFTVMDFMQIFPYGLTQLNEERLTTAVQRGFLAVAGQGEFRATDSGANVTQQVLRAFDLAVAQLKPLPEEPLQRLVGHVQKLTEAAFAAAKPPANIYLNGKRNMRRYRMMGLTHQFEQYISELTGYRDDVYRTIWQSHNIAGHTWEVFDQLSIGGMLMFNDLHERTSRRGVTHETHVEDMKELIRRGWAKEEKDECRITILGKKVREDVETETERLFFTPWSCLNESELNDFSSSSAQLTDGLKRSESK